MYINDVHILTYAIFFVLGAIIGQSINWINSRVLGHKKIFSKEIKQEFKNKIKINYFYVVTVAILYTIILFEYGISPNFLENLELVKYIVLIPILISIIIIDYKKRIIPNRLTLTIFETGIIFAFLYGLNNLFIARDYLLGAIVGLLIFTVIAILGRLIAGKEAMGVGDIKLLATLGLYFGTALTISISIISFVTAAIISIYAIVLEKKKGKKIEYIPLGPYICLAAIICVIIPKNTVISILLMVFTLGRYKM